MGQGFKTKQNLCEFRMVPTRTTNFKQMLPKMATEENTTKSYAKQLTLAL